ncbi:aldose epimerase family protein [Cellulophaga fucicola]|uniref:Aldose 1-epimerase n=1 Tax=Cellulophaga fucicola TaxID=76595 RepID=A0A1K1Q1D6_9FLAO|nr:aldose epimerase family protein [Cellulophaga fucicola]SFW53499.1 aldose 1-epimerase [Cellulophaga fucicola]
MLPQLLNAADFDTILNGKKVALYTLTNKQGSVAQITNYGGTVVSLWVKDKEDNFKDVVLGYKTLEEYRTNPNAYFGSIVGRYANRIAKGKFTLDNKTYTLATNNGENHLHGGTTGFDAAVWVAKQTCSHTLELTYVSGDMEEGYPGNLAVTVQYQLTEDNALKITYWAITDKTTIINLTNHSYFNLKGEGNGDILDHNLQINAEKFTSVDQTCIPTGELIPVKNTPLDFTKEKTIGKDINANYDQLKIGNGYDHNYVINQTETLNLAAKVTEPTAGIVMDVFTTEPGIQLYTGNFITDTVLGKTNKKYHPRAAFCLETQHYPDSPNKPNFPSVILQPKEEYHSVTLYKFSTKA